MASAICIRRAASPTDTKSAAHTSNGVDRYNRLSVLQFAFHQDVDAKRDETLPFRVSLPSISALTLFNFVHVALLMSFSWQKYSVSEEFEFALHTLTT